MSAAEAQKSPWGQTRRTRSSQFPVKREAVLSAAAALMRRNGYNSTSLAELAEILNITKPTLYYYIGSKEELFSEIVARGQTAVLDFMKAIAAEPDMTGYEKLRSIMLKYVEYNGTDFGACVMVAAPPDIGADIGRQIRARTREANEILYQVLAEGEKDRTLRVSDSTVVLHALFGSLNWIPRWHKPSGRLSLRKIAELQVQILLDGVRGEAAQENAAPKAAPRTRRKAPAGA